MEEPADRHNRDPRSWWCGGPGMSAGRRPARPLIVDNLVNIRSNGVSMTAMRFAVIGLGEAGGIYATGLAADADVVGTDPAVSTAPPGVRLATGIPDAVADADIVLSLVGARAARTVLDAAAPAMRRSAVFADLNTGRPDEKAHLATIAGGAGIRFADVAVMAPVPRAGIRTPLFAAGSGAAAFADAMRPFGAPVEVVGDEAGAAAGLKLIRSVFMKGLAGLVLESLDAAERIGATDLVRNQIAAELGPDGGALVDRLVTGSRQHAVRREHEMHDVRAYLDSLGTPPRMTDGTIAWLADLAAAAEPVRG